MNLRFRSGRVMPVSHVFKWIGSQLLIGLALFGPWVYIAFAFYEWVAS